MRLILATAILGMGAMAFQVTPAAADHSWGNYHWARTSNPFTVKLTDHVTSAWNSHLSAVSSDWSNATVLDTSVVASFETKRCKAVSGRIEVCNGKYGKNGWLGLSQIWVSGGHITASTAKVNDTYFTLPQYNLPAARQSVLCMEIGHSLGLDHQDGAGDSCMDDLSYDWPKIMHPNTHDYAQLETIYSHTDSSSTLASSAQQPSGKKGTVKRLSKSLYVENLGGGRTLFTWVYWEGPAAAARASDTQPPS